MRAWLFWMCLAGCCIFFFFEWVIIYHVYLYFFMIFYAVYWGRYKVLYGGVVIFVYVYMITFWGVWFYSFSFVESFLISVGDYSFNFIIHILRGWE